MMTSPSAPAALKEQFIVRFPAGMREQLKQIAAANRRSMNAELLLLIERGLGANDQGLGGQATRASKKNKA